jgi:hypothetical protein
MTTEILGNNIYIQSGGRNCNTNRQREEILDSRKYVGRETNNNWGGGEV